MNEAIIRMFYRTRNFFAFVFWPWGVIRQLRADKERMRSDLWAIINEIDPHYIQRQSFEAAMSSPRMNCVITGIKVPQ